MLREMLRDTARDQAPGANARFGADTVFFQVLQQLQQKYRAREMSTRDFLSAFAAVLPPELRYEGHASLDWFFDGWIDGTALPSYEIKELKMRNLGAGKRSASLRLLQQDAPKSLVTSVPIYAELQDGRLVLISRVFADGEETELKLTVPAATRRLVVDPFHTVLTRP
jgi:hypothetical protein